MSSMIGALIGGLISIVLSLVMWGFSADAEASADVPALYKPLYPLFAGEFLLGGHWSMAAGLGLVPSPREIYHSHRG